MRGVSGVCEMCMCMARVRGEGGEWIRGLSFGFTNPVETGVKYMCLCFCVAVVWVV